MNRLRILKQRAARQNLGIIKSLTGEKGWDTVDSCGPAGLLLTKRAAINLIGSCKPSKIKVYVRQASGMWHRGGCEVVAPAFAAVRRPCNCQRLSQNTPA